MRLVGRVVLITGAASGIGRATAMLAAGEGASIAAIDVDEPGFQSTVDAVRSAAGQISARVADVAEHEELSFSIRSLAAEVGAIDGVFANAAVLPPPVPAAEIDWQEWDRVLEVNLRGAVLTLVAALPQHYSRAMATTMQVSEASRDRLRALGRPGATLEETLVEALDALEREQFWSEAEAAEVRRRAMSADELAAVTAAEGDTQRWLDAL